MMLTVSLLIALVTGLELAWLLRPSAWSAACEFPLLVFLSLGLGLGVLSLWFFLCLLIFGPRRNALIASEIVIVAVLAILLLIYLTRSRSIFAPAAPPARAWWWLWYVPGTAFVAALLVAGLAFTRYSVAGPHGAWDAWGDWNLRARFLYLGGRHWTDLFSPRGTLPHRDYPLLLSASVARCWTYMKSDAQRAPIAIALLFTFATAGELCCSLSLLRSRSQGVIAATVLLATPFFLVLGSAQYADVPLAFFFLSTTVLLCWHEHGNSRSLVLAGLAAGLAAWTKNEGSLFLLCLLVSHLFLTVRNRGWKAYGRELRTVSAGLLPVLAVVIFFKLRFAWRTDLLAHPGMLHRLGEASRYRLLFRSLIPALLPLGGWSLSVPLLLVAYVLLLGIEKQAGRLAAKIGTVTLALTALGYLLVYLTTWLPLQWLLFTSLTRLYIQLYPSALFLIFVFAKTPEEALGRRFA